MSPGRQAAEDLRAARALIEDRDRWTQRAAARDEAGAVVIASGPAACRWCAVGALFRIIYTPGDDDAATLESPRWTLPYDALEAAARELYGDEGYASTAAVNDYKGHSATLAVYARAVERLAA